VGRLVRVGNVHLSSERTNMVQPVPKGIEGWRGGLMFLELEREFSLARWIGQLLIAYCRPALLVGLWEILFRGADTPIWQALAYPITGLIGVAAGPSRGLRGALSFSAGQA